MKVRGPACSGEPRSSAAYRAGRPTEVGTRVAMFTSTSWEVPPVNSSGSGRVLSALAAWSLSPAVVAPGSLMTCPATGPATAGSVPVVRLTTVGVPPASAITMSEPAGPIATGAPAASVLTGTTVPSASTGATSVPSWAPVAGPGDQA